nr:antimicrobial protein [uncultured bacterium]
METFRSKSAQATRATPLSSPSEQTLQPRSVSSFATEPPSERAPEQTPPGQATSTLSARMETTVTASWIPGYRARIRNHVIAVSCVKLLSAHNSTQHTSRKHKVSLGCLMETSELTHINCVALTARFPVGKPVVPAALMETNRPTRGERRFAYWALFRFLAHLAALGRSAAASGISSLKGGNTVIHRIRGRRKEHVSKRPAKGQEPKGRVAGVFPAPPPRASQKSTLKSEVAKPDRTIKIPGVSPWKLPRALSCSDPAAYRIPVRLSPFGKRGAFSLTLVSQFGVGRSLQAGLCARTPRSARPLRLSRLSSVQPGRHDLSPLAAATGTGLAERGMETRATEFLKWCLLRLHKNSIWYLRLCAVTSEKSVASSGNKPPAGTVVFLLPSDELRRKEFKRDLNSTGSRTPLSVGRN